MRQQQRNNAVGSSPNVVGEMVQNQNPDKHKSDGKPNQSLFNWVKNHKITVGILAIFYFSLTAVMNYFSNNPRMFYFPAIVACLAFCWIVLSATHKFVTSQIKGTPATNLLATGNNLSNNPPPVVSIPTLASNSITTPNPLAITREIYDARPMQQQAISETFNGAKVRWLLYFFGVNTDKILRLVMFADRKPQLGGGDNSVQGGFKRRYELIAPRRQRRSVLCFWNHF